MRAAVLALVLLATLPAAAGAATARVDVYREPPDTDPFESCSRYAQCPPDTLWVDAAPGEANDMTITRAGTVFVVRDATAPVKALAGCVQADEHTATCHAQVVATVALGDGDDRVTSEAGDVRGGPGDDVLTIATGDGGPGADTIACASRTSCSLSGGPGPDRVVGGPGHDRITDAGGPGDDDLLDGGAGIDVVSFTGHRGPVTVDVSASPQRFAAPGERGTLAGFETVVGGEGDDMLTGAPGVIVPASLHGIQLRGGNGDDRIVARSRIPVFGDGGDDTIRGSAGGLPVEGGHGDDVLTGSPGTDRLYGERGDDVLRGLSGADVLDGSSGADALDGGPGSDRLDGGTGPDALRGGAGADVLAAAEHPPDERLFRDAVLCGPGAPDVARLDRLDRLGAGCERVTRVAGGSPT